MNTHACTQSDYSHHSCVHFYSPSFKWSQCSLDQFAFSFEHGLDICLHNVPKTIQPDNAICGNGIVENDEQCDCGNSTNQVLNSNCCIRKPCIVYALNGGTITEVCFRQLRIHASAADSRPTVKSPLNTNVCKFHSMSNNSVTEENFSTVS